MDFGDPMTNEPKAHSRWSATGQKRTVEGVYEVRGDFAS